MSNPNPAYPYDNGPQSGGTPTPSPASGAAARYDAANGAYDTAGRQHSGPQYVPGMQGMPGNGRPRDYRFFGWVRRTGLSRGDDRWIGGVGSGLAARLGWNPTLVRALLAGSTLIFGFGLVLYGIAWLLLPDARDGRILLEELVAARWDWACVGAFACIIIPVLFLFTGYMGFAGVMVIGAAVVVLWALGVSSIRQQKGYGFAYHGGPVSAAGGFAGKAAGTAHPAAGGAGVNPSAPFQQSGMPEPATEQAFANGGETAPGMPGEQSAPAARTGNNSVFDAGFGAASDSGAASGFAADASIAASKSDDPTLRVPASSQQERGLAMNDSATANGVAGESAGSPPVGSAARTNAGIPAEVSMPAPAQTFAYGAEASSRAPQGSATASAAPLPPVQYRQPKPRYARRKPAGPMVVLLTMGAILISAALMMSWLSANTSVYPIESYLPAATLWTGGVCLALGVIITLLGFLGRRAGGLNPIAWLAAIMAMTMLWLNLSYSYLLHRADELDTGYSTAWLYGDDLGGSATDDTSSGLMALRGADMKQGGVDNNDKYTLNYLVSDASPKSMARLERGVRFEGDGGDSYNEARANIDLTGYGYWHGGDAKTCPTGQIKVAVDKTRLFVTLPDGCPFSIGEGDWGYDFATRVGGRNSIVLDNSYAYLGMNDDYWYSAWTDNKNWEWVQRAYEGQIDSKDMLHIDIAYAIEGRVTIQYASDSKIPGYAQYADFWMRSFEKNENDDMSLSKKAQHHAAVTRGEEKPTAEDMAAGK